jgi:hypothetical protein
VPLSDNARARRAPDPRPTGAGDQWARDLFLGLRNCCLHRDLRPCFCRPAARGLDEEGPARPLRVGLHSSGAQGGDMPRLTRLLANAVALVSLVMLAVDCGRSLAQRATLLRSRPPLHLNTSGAFGGTIGLGRRLRTEPKPCILGPQRPLPGPQTLRAREGRSRVRSCLLEQWRETARLRSSRGAPSTRPMCRHPTQPWVRVESPTVASAWASPVPGGGGAVMEKPGHSASGFLAFNGDAP